MAQEKEGRRTYRKNDVFPVHLQQDVDVEEAMVRPDGINRLMLIVEQVSG